MGTKAHDSGRADAGNPLPDGSSRPACDFQPTEGDVQAWRDSLLHEDSGRLVGLARNYLGSVRTPFDKRELIVRLESLLRRPETGTATVALLSRTDILILGSILLSGPIPEPALKGLFAGEFPLAELGSRLANLGDRLLVYRQEYADGARVAITPFLVGVLAPIATDARLLFGPEPGSAIDESAASIAGRDRKAGAELASVGLKALALFAFLTDHHGALRKDGSLSTRAAVAIRRICPDVGTQFAAALFGVLTSSGLVEGGRDEGRIDVDTLERIFWKNWESLAWRLALARSGGDPSAAPVVAATLEPFFSRGFLFSRQGLARLLRISCWRNGCAEDDPALVDAMLELGMIEAVDNGLQCRPEALVAPAKLAQQSSSQANSTQDAAKLAQQSSSQVNSTQDTGRPILAAEGSGILHLMPEASLQDRLFLISTARPVRLSGLWDFELDARSARRAFARGADAAGLIRALEKMEGRELPQALSFSLSSWEEEYRKLRLFRGSFLAVDAPTSEILEASGVAAALGAEKVSTGMYFLGNAPHERIEEALASIGMEIPPAIRTAKPPVAISRDSDLGDASALSWGNRNSERIRAYGGKSGSARRPTFDPGIDIAGSLDGGDRLAHELKAILSGFAILPALKGDLEERIARKLVLDGDQLERLAGLQARPKSGGGAREPGAAKGTRRPAPFLRDQIAGAMDYQGKLRLIRQALKSPLDRIEVQWSPREGERRTAMLRPTGLEQNEKGHTLEAEDLGTGGPARIGVGAMSSVRLVRASYFGDDT
ncbi:MAG: helicase-associated domain-containing protein [Rectinema sp.]